METVLNDGELKIIIPNDFTNICKDVLVEHLNNRKLITKILVSSCLFRAPAHQIPLMQDIFQVIRENCTDLTCLGFTECRFPIDLSMCYNLKNLALGNLMDQPLDLSKLTNLEMLTIAGDFNRKLDLRLLTNLKSISFCDGTSAVHDFNQVLDLSTLSNLEALVMNYNFT